jgi:hypothetical protein
MLGSLSHYTLPTFDLLNSRLMKLKKKYQDNLNNVFKRAPNFTFRVRTRDDTKVAAE